MQDDGRDETLKERDAFDVNVDVFEAGWCSCCPSFCTMPLATIIAVVLGIVTGVILYEVDVQDTWVDCYTKPSGSTSTTTSLEACVNGDEGCIDVNGFRMRITTSSTATKPPLQSCWFEIFEYPGMLWIRALKCTVAPLIACMMLLIPGKLKALGPVGQKVAILLLSTSFVAALEGLLWGNIFRPGDLIKTNDVDTFGGKAPPPNYVKELESFLNIGIKAVPVNIVSSLSSLSVLGIITFFLTFGYYLEYDCPAVWREPIVNAGRGFLRATLNVLMLILWAMPVAMFSILAYNTMKTDLESVAGAVGLYLACQLIAQFLHLTVFYFLFYYIMTGRNPILFYYNIFRAPATALLTSSSAATLPVTLQVNKAERGDDYFGRQVVEFVVPLGAAINMDGTSLGFPIMVLFVSQVGEKLDSYAFDGITGGNQLLVALLAMVCSLGTAPIPNAGMVYLTMLLEAADITDPNLQGLGIGMIMLVDWIVDRVETAQNVGSDSFISAIISYSKMGFFSGLKEESARQVTTSAELSARAEKL